MSDTARPGRLGTAAGAALGGFRPYGRGTRSSQRLDAAGGRTAGRRSDRPVRARIGSGLPRLRGKCRSRLYRQALAGGLSGIRRRRATIQLASTLRNLGQIDESIALLEAEQHNAIRRTRRCGLRLSGALARRRRTSRRRPRGPGAGPAGAPSAPLQSLAQALRRRVAAGRVSIPKQVVFPESAAHLGLLERFRFRRNRTNALSLRFYAFLDGKPLRTFPGML